MHDLMSETNFFLHPLRALSSYYGGGFQASGVKIDASCKNAYDMLHNKHQHSYIIFKVIFKSFNILKAETQNE